MQSLSPRNLQTILMLLTELEKTDIKWHKSYSKLCLKIRLIAKEKLADKNRKYRTKINAS